MSRWNQSFGGILKLQIALAPIFYLLLAQLSQTTFGQPVEEVGPLDDWQHSDRPKTNTPTPTAGPTKTYYTIIQSTPTPDPSLKPLARPKPSIAGGEFITLNKIQRARLGKVEKRVRKKVWEEIAKKSQWVDPRGPAEIRICSVDLNGYGEKSDVNRIYKKKGVQRLKKTKGSFLEIVKRAECDVVALQGVVGRSLSFAVAEVKSLVEELNKVTGVTWKAVAPDSKRRSAYHFFLLRNPGSGRILSYLSTTHTDLVIDVQRYGETETEMVPRDFLQISLQVSRVPDKSTQGFFGPTGRVREVVVINGGLSGIFSPLPANQQQFKLQIAEVAAALHQREENEVTPDKKQIVLLIANRDESIHGAAQEILTGRLKVSDFKPSTKGKEDELCKIVLPEPEPQPKKGKGKAIVEGPIYLDTHIECREPIHRPQILFDILAGASKTISAKTKKKETPPNRVVGFFLTQSDLIASVRNADKSSANMVGSLPIENGIPGAELVWADLNW